MGAEGGGCGAWGAGGTADGQSSVSEPAAGSARGGGRWDEGCEPQRGVHYRVAAGTVAASAVATDIGNGTGTLAATALAASAFATSGASTGAADGTFDHQSMVH